MFDREKQSDSYSGGMAMERETILGDDTKFKGSLKFQNNLTINGVFDGNLSSKGSLLIGQTGKVTAEVKVGNIIIEGKVTGNVTADDKIELRSSAELYGDIRAKRIVISEGATFIGKSDVNPNQEEVPAPPTPRTEKKTSPSKKDKDSERSTEKEPLFGAVS